MKFVRFGSLVVLCLVIGTFVSSISQAAPKTVLIYRSSLASTVGETQLSEKAIAAELGMTAITVGDQKWAAMSTADFAKFNAIIVSDGSCDVGEAALSTMKATGKVWGAAVHGPIVLSGFDPSHHAIFGGGPAGPKIQLMKNILNYVTGGSSTGFYAGGIGCYFDGDQTLAFLQSLGTIGLYDHSGNQPTIVQPSSPLMIGLSNNGLSKWGASYHNAFSSFPSYFQVIVNGVSNSQTLPVLIAAPSRP